MKRLFLIFFLIFVLCGVIYSEELKIIVKKTIIENDLSTDAKVTDLKNDPKIDSTGDITREIRIGSDYLCITENDIKSIYDFKNKNIYKVDNKNKIYNKYSLFSVLGFNIAEIQNRFYLKKIFESSLEKTLPADKSFNLESLFSIVYDKKNKPEVQIEYKDNLVIYKNENEKYVTCKYKKVDEYSSYLAIYYRYLVHECVIHPEIVKLIINENKFPEFMEYRYINMNTEVNVKEVIKNLDIVDEMSFVIPDDYKEEYLISNKVMDIVLNIKNKKFKRTTEDEYKEFINNKFKKRNYLDSYLGVLEHALETGVLLEKENKMVFTKYKKEKEFKNYVDGLMLSRENKYKEANEIFKNINRKKLEKGYIIDTQIGAMYLSLGEVENAMDSYINVLNNNPYVTGALKDLGDLYYNRYDTITSWFLWDLAREIAPEHSMLTNITEYEKQMIIAFPEYFYEEK